MTTPLDDPTAAFLSGYAAAVHAKDAQAFAALYADDVAVFDMWGAWQHDGLAAWHGMAVAWFGSLGTEQVRVEFSDARSTVTHELIVAHVFVTYTALDDTGATLRSLTNRMTVALRRTGAGWKVVHEHSSAPLDPQTAKAMFSR